MRARFLAPLLAVASLGVAPAAHATRTVSGCKGCPRADLSAAAETNARGALRALAPGLRLRADGRDLRLLGVRRTPAGTAVRFRQIADGIPVSDAQVVVVLAADGTVDWVASGARDGIRPSSTTPAVPEASAVAIARARVPGGDLRSAPAAELVVAPRPGGRGVLAWDVRVPTARPWHDWRVVLSAATGSVLDLGDDLRHVDGTANVYDPNPVQGTNDPTLTDAGAPAPVIRPLTDLVGTKLAGARADMTTGPVSGCTGSYTPGLADEPTHIYAYLRNNPRFAEANAYYAITRTAKLYDALGFPTVMAHAIPVNVHCIADDQSFYSSFDRALRFGDGGVDDAEDGDIVVHEYGHATQDDQVPGFAPGSGPTEQGAIGEGWGDLLAVMVHIQSGSADWQSGHRFCVGEWDATSYLPLAEAGCLRWTDGRGTGGGIGNYPGTPSAVHDDGRFWSAAMTCVFTAMEAAGTPTLTARDNLLKLVLAHNELLVPTDGPAFSDSGRALVNVDRTLFGGAHLAMIKSCLEPRLNIVLDIDGTPPDVTPIVSPASPDGANGWYRSNVGVTWSVADQQSPPAPVAGCGPTTVDQDTTGVTLTCSATSVGGTTIRSMLIRRDAAPPLLAPRPQGFVLRIGRTRAVRPNATDATSGVARASCAAPDSSRRGARRLRCRATDAAGNSASVPVSYVVVGRPRANVAGGTVAKDGSVTVRLRADQDATATVKATAQGGVTLRSKPVALKRSVPRVVQLTGDRNARDRLRTALRRRGQTLTLTIALRDATGTITRRKARLKVPRTR